MNPPTLMQLLQMHQQMVQSGQLPAFGQPDGQMPTLNTPQPQGMQPPQVMPQQAPQGDPAQQHHGLSPLTAISPIGGLFASNPKMAMSFLSPAFGLAHLLGAFK